MTSADIDGWYNHFRRHFPVVPECDLAGFKTICDMAKTSLATQSETLLTNAAPQPSTAVPGTAPSQEGVGQRDAAAAAPSDDKEDDAWRAAALRLGEQLAPTGPNWYYAMTPTQWLEWCRSALPSAELARNQCDGCQRGLPIREGKYHDLTGTVGAYPGEVMGCTADRYIPSASGALIPEKIIEALREVCYVPGHFEAIAHLKYCRWCHYVETQPHGHDCPMLLLESAATDSGTSK